MKTFYAKYCEIYNRVVKEAKEQYYRRLKKILIVK
jgi:hypothetical protein